MGTCVIYGAVLAPDIREISRSILSTCELVPPRWLCPGTGWLLSPCLTYQAPLQQISLLPIPVDIMRLDLQAARGVCVCVCARCASVSRFVYECFALHSGMGEERILRRLEIYWLPFALSLPPLPSSPNPGSFIPCLFIYRGLPECVALQRVTDFEWPAFS